MNGGYLLEPKTMLSAKIWKPVSKFQLNFSIFSIQNSIAVSFENQRTIGPENAHMKSDLGVLSHHEMTLTFNTHTPLLTSQVVCICKVSGHRLQ